MNSMVIRRPTPRPIGAIDNSLTNFKLADTLRTDLRSDGNLLDRMRTGRRSDAHMIHHTPTRPLRTSGRAHYSPVLEGIMTHASPAQSLKDGDSSKTPPGDGAGAPGRVVSKKPRGAVRVIDMSSGRVNPARARALAPQSAFLDWKRSKQGRAEKKNPCCSPSYPVSFDTGLRIIDPCGVSIWHASRLWSHLTFQRDFG